MMKKVLAFVLAGVMTLGGAFTALATEEAAGTAQEETTTEAPRQGDEPADGGTDGNADGEAEAGNGTVQRADSMDTGEQTGMTAGELEAMIANE